MTAMAMTEEALRERVAREVKSYCARMCERLEQAGASQALLDQVGDLSRIAQAELAADQGKRAAEIEVLSELTAPEVIRYAEQLIRLRYSPISPLYRVWGKVADTMNSVSHLPERSDWGGRNSDVMRFNDTQAMAWAIIDQNHGYVGRVRL